MSSPITVRICPATSNLPTRMTRQSWVALCRATQQREAGAAASARSWNENLSGQIAVGSNYCAECQGQHLPPGLEFIDAAELAASTETPEEDIWLAAIQTAALLEEAELADLEYRSLFVGMRGQIERQSADLKNIKSAIGLLEDAEVSEVTGALAELTQALGRFRNLAEAADARADRFAQAAEQAQSSADLLLAEKNLADERADVAEAQVTAIREALRAQESDESTIEVAERRMVVMAKLDKMYGESEERIGKIERHCEALKAENARLNDLLAAQNETVADYIDPYREAMADFGLRVLRGEACLTFTGG